MLKLFVGSIHEIIFLGGISFMVRMNTQMGQKLLLSFLARVLSIYGMKTPITHIRKYGSLRHRNVNRQKNKKLANGLFGSFNPVLDL